ncbi:MAG: polysaccharide biosynthesis/export family protein [Dysgonamonadaceae bacterium]|jgi:polysaccharide export outer membrane protein|nr:polysaccharide biosynthesis/export family protein [Dysgonamonadaceae bacterium]
MKFCKTLFVAVPILLLGACSTPKQITYFQDLRPGESEQILAAPMEIRIQPKDKLSILVNSQDFRLTNMFNLPIVLQQIGQESGMSGTSRGLSGYTVDSNGEIDFFALGKIRVQDLTREEVATLIKQKLQSHELVKDPMVTVEFMNLSVSVFGDVNRPGRYNIDRDHFSILDALSQAGDLTIYGKREKVLVLRNENGVQRTYGVNLCSAEQLYSSPAYYLQQNDVVYVEPNDTKARQSTVNGNNVRSTSFWISVTSLLATISVIIINTTSK